MQTGETRAREAALLLHGLVPAQREAVLTRLAPGHLARLRPLLDELATLRIPPSLAHVQARAHGGAAAALAARAGGAPATPDPQRAGRALRACAATTAAALLRDAPPAWRASVLAELPRDRRRDIVERLGGAPALPPRVAEALHRRLCEETAGRLGRGRTAERCAASGGWKRWLRWTR